MLVTRPGTLAEVQRLVRTKGEKLRHCLAGFLDDFYADRDPVGRRARIADDPGLTQIGDGRCAGQEVPIPGRIDAEARLDAPMGAIGEHLSTRWRLGPAPAWTDDPARFLSRPWFLGPERFKPFLLVESPAAYRRRFIFTEAEPLRRIGMPRDGRWWAYETMRTGLVPQPGEIEASAEPPPAVGHRSMQAEHAVDRADLRRLDQA
ncbi:MAG: hypothetical protein ABSG76_04570 [Xanthobacteraceae bacterium]|jgi:hypothetical protein